MAELYDVGSNIERRSAERKFVAVLRFFFVVGRFTYIMSEALILVIPFFCFFFNSYNFC